MGLGRTFQRMQLFDSLSVAQNVALGYEARVAGVNPLWQVVSTPRQRAATRKAAAEAINLCGLADVRDVPAGALSTGRRRLVELARCIAGDFDMLLLDEPSSGLDTAETERFAEILESLCRDRGVGMLLVEHDLGLVMRVSSQVYVLDFGELIFHGTPAEVMASPVVQAAYLGDSTLMEEAEVNAV
jgi:ABC-type branched-subunit amino acid transport system ATPase component